MTHRVAFVLACVLAACVVADLVFNGGQTLFFLSVKTVDLINYLAFWR